MTEPLAVAVVDLGLGNLRSVARSIELGAERRVPARVSVTPDPAAILAADRVVVPGQGAFRDGSRALEGALGDALRTVIARGTPYLGICLGLQLLFESSEEAPGARGLGIFRGDNARLVRSDPSIKIPHMGWNEIDVAAAAPPALRAAHDVSRWFYFVHSFHARPVDASIVAATCTHGTNVVTAAVASKNVLGVQFHPEKSQRAGLVLLDRFLEG